MNIPRYDPLNRAYYRLLGKIVINKKKVSLLNWLACNYRNVHARTDGMPFLHATTKLARTISAKAMVPIELGRTEIMTTMAKSFHRAWLKKFVWCRREFDRESRVVVEARSFCVELDSSFWRFVSFVSECNSSGFCWLHGSAFRMRVYQ